jgi:hypothetical protein
MYISIKKINEMIIIKAKLKISYDKDISMENIAALEDHFERTAVLLRTPQKVTKPNLNRSEDSAIDIAYSYSTTHSDEHFEERNLTHDILDFSGVSGYSSHTSWNQHRYLTFERCHTF